MKSFRIFSALIVFILLVSFVPASATPITDPAPGPAATSAAVPLNPFSTGPSYDSGWRNIAQGQTISMWHQLGGAVANYFVDLQTRRYGGVTGISNRFIGGNDQSGSEDRQGAYWHGLNSNYISVTRQPEDTLVDAVRVRIWEVGSADWSSGWTAIDPGHYYEFHPPLIANNPIENYVVDLMFSDNGILGVNQRAYGGRTLGINSMNFDPGARVGAYWYDLKNGSIQVYRMNEDEYADQVLVRIWFRQLPTYDSGWFTMAPNTTHVFTHNIGGNPDDYRVDMEFKSDNSNWGINQCYYGGTDIHEKSPYPPGYKNDQLGAYWQRLNGSTLSVYRLPEDNICADQVRIRIWNFWTPTRPDFDSGWKSVAAGGLQTYDPGITGSLDPYLVDLQFKDSGFPNIGINQRGLGGLDWTDGSKQGGFWTYANGFFIIARRDDDENANYMRLRLWKMPKPAYDSGWQTIPIGEYTYFCNHNLGADARDFLVDLEFKDSSGTIHTMGYGGYEVTYGTDPDYGHRLGAYWEGLDENRLSVYRNKEATSIDKIRVRIWTLARPDYDSGMVTPASDSTVLDHNLGGKAENYFLSLVFYDPDVKDLHQRYYGGSVVVNPVGGNVLGDRVGAYYRLLTTASVTVYRNPEEDYYIDQYRMRMWVGKQLVHIPTIKK